MSGHTSILIMAAGASSRMQKIKQLLPWGELTLIEHMVEAAIESEAKSCYVLLGAHKEKIHPKIKSLAAEVIENENWEKGMGNGIAKGVQAILQKERPEAILIMLCDQPLIDTAFIDQLIKGFLKNKDRIRIVGTRYNSKIGVPAIFSSSLFNDLLSLDSEGGAAQLIADHISHTIAIDPRGKERDMDTWDDYIELRPE